jgi:hypothetical protein
MLLNEAIMYHAVVVALDARVVCETHLRHRTTSVSSIQLHRSPISLQSNPILPIQSLPSFSIFRFFRFNFHVSPAAMLSSTFRDKLCTGSHCYKDQLAVGSLTRHSRHEGGGLVLNLACSLVHCMHWKPRCHYPFTCKRPDTL